MKQENFLFVDVISSIFLLILLLCNFLGLVYVTEGNMLISLAGSLLVVIFYYFVLQLLKRNKERMFNVGYLKSPATFFFAVFIVFGLVSYFFMIHLVNIETNCKVKLQKEAEEKMTLVKKLTTDYKNVANESLQSFEAKFKNKLLAYKIHRTNILRNELSQAPFSLPDAILNSPSQNIDVTASTDATLNAYRIKISENNILLDSLIFKKADYYTKSFNQWDRLNLSTNYNDLNNFVKTSLILVNDKIKELPINNEPFLISIKDNELPLENPVKLAKLYTPNYVIPFIIILVMHLFILIPFWTYRVPIYRRSQNNGRKGEVVNHGGTVEI
ncbi:hypothetical protein [Pedobacter immunditicola]|uniref:hypothetical protein n=1 Tax=Pedobacter immunditicola TaxID=3133440 RepID=UPI0030979B1D